jgi:predicted GNAT family acetyltransferase
VTARLYEGPADIASIVRDVYHPDPVLFTMELASLARDTLTANQILLSIDDGHHVIGAAMRRRGARLLVSGLPPAVASEAAEALVQLELPGLRGTPTTAAAFTQAWSQATGARAEQGRSDTLYRLRDFNPPAGVAGGPRAATEDDAELVAGWLVAFGVEALGEQSNIAAGHETFRRIAASGGQLALWTVDDAPVAMARVHAPAVGVSRIGPVYTPPQSRGNGYGAAVTSEAVQHAKSLGARDVVLFADVANPGSNRIYQRMGFVAVDGNVEYVFTPA